MLKDIDRTKLSSGHHSRLRDLFSGALFNHLNFTKTQAPIFVWEMRCLLMFYFLLYMAFLYFCYRPLMGTSNQFHLASPQAPDTTMAWVHVARWGFVVFFFLIFVTCPTINEKALSLICLPAPENTILSFLVLLCELSQVNPELDISWLRDQL